jgi:TolA-binding protein
MADTFQTALDRYRDAKEAFRDQRDRMLEDAEFSNPANPQQWDDAARRIRENGPDGARPCLTLDHTNQYIRQVVNAARQNKPGLTAMPASGGARVEVARVIEGMFRHIEYRSRAQIAYDTAVEHAARMGLGWIRVMPEVVNAKLNHQEIKICRVHNPLAVIPDPNWKEPDGNDLKWIFYESSLSKKEFQARYPKAELRPFNESGTESSWFQENTVRIAEYLEVVEKEQQRLVVRLLDGSRQDVTSDEYWNIAKQQGTQPMLEAQYMGQDRKTMWRVMSGAEILEETVFPSRWTGFVPVVGSEVWVDEKRYLSGMVRSMMEAQRAYNYERSAWVEAVALQPKAPYMAATEAIEGFEDAWAAANRSNKAYLPWNAFDDQGNPLPMPGRVAVPQLPAAFAQGAQFADQDIQASVGMYRASLGAPTAEHSGVALRQKRQEGDTATFHIPDNLSGSVEMVGRICVDMMPRIYDEVREARILGADGSTKPVKIDPQGDVYDVRPNGEESINLGTGEYDVRCKAGPSYTTLREEAADHLTQLMQGQPAIASVVAPIWAQMMDWPQADKLSKALLAMAPPPVQAALNEQGAQDPQQLQQQLQQCQQQLEHMQQMVQMAGEKLQEAQNEQQKNHLDALTKAAQISVDQYNAETNRLKVVAPAVGEEQVQAIVMRMLQEILGAQPLGQPQAADIPPGDGSPGPLAPPDPGQGTEQPNEAPTGASSISGAAE